MSHCYNCGEHDAHCTCFKSREKPEPKKHKHYDLISEWIKDTTRIVQFWDGIAWVDLVQPSWSVDCEFRFKPETKPDTVSYLHNWADGPLGNIGYFHPHGELSERAVETIKLTRCGETGKLKSAEVIK